MKQITSWNGQVIREMFAAGTAWLEKSAAEIDALNVFPVPDGDTGTNMLLTMRSSLTEAYRISDGTAAEVMSALAYGALMGARGNSGVILSQFFSGLASGLKGKETVGVNDLARALKEAVTKSRKCLTKPVEGTLLTVIRDVSEAARAAAEISDDLLTAMDFIVRSAGDSVARTPVLLAVLREAGVVDAGGQGLYVLLEGAYNHLQGEGEKMRYRKPVIVASSLTHAVRLPPLAAEEQRSYGYCTEFLLQTEKSEKLGPEVLRKKLRHRGDSLIVAGDSSVVRVHIHTFDPGDILHLAGSLGVLHGIRIQNIDDQHQDFIQMQKVKAPAVDIAKVAVVSGNGLSEVFKSIGATAIVPGGDTMNPSTKEVLHIVSTVLADKVILLPNHKNVIPVAKQVQSLSKKKKVVILPTESIPQGVAALLAFDYEASLDENMKAMRKAAAGVKTVEVSRAVRASRLGDGRIRKGQAIGFLNGELVSNGSDMKEVVGDVMEKAEAAKAEIITLYYGAYTKAAEAQSLAESLRRKYGQAEVEVVCGAQPNYNYIISVE